jgi:hypothetical protein
MRSLFLVTLLSLVLFLCCVPSTFALDERATPVIIPPDSLLGLAAINFTNTCNGNAKVALALGIQALHSFSYDEAGAFFEDARRQDPSCAISYWGSAMCQWTPLFYPLGLSATQIATAATYLASGLALVTPNTSQKEKDYLQAAITLFQGNPSSPYSANVLAFEEQMKQLYYKYLATDTEIVPFYALSLAASALANPSLGPNQAAKAGKLLELYLLDNPNHPGALNYLIQTYSGYLVNATVAAPYAQTYSGVSMNTAFPLYTPSRIYNWIGSWQLSKASTVLALQAAQTADAIRYANNDYVKNGENYMRILAARAYAFLQECQDHEVLAMINAINNDLRPVATDTAARAMVLIPARYYFETERWQAATSFSLGGTVFQWNQYPWADIVVYFVRTMAWTLLNNMDEAMPNLNRLVQAKAYWDSNADAKAALDPAWTQSLERMYAICLVWTDWMKTVRNSEAGEGELTAVRDALVARLQAIAMTGTGTENPEMVITPAEESLGDMLLMMDRRRAAIGQFEYALQKMPNRFHAVYGACKAACLLYVYGDSGMVIKKEEVEMLFKCKAYHRLLHELCHPDIDENHCGERKIYTELNDLMRIADGSQDPDSDLTTDVGASTGTSITPSSTGTSGSPTTSEPAVPGPTPEEIQAAKLRKVLWLLAISAVLGGLVLGFLFVLGKQMRKRGYQVLGPH